MLVVRTAVTCRRPLGLDRAGLHPLAGEPDRALQAAARRHGRGTPQGDQSLGRGQRPEQHLQPWRRTGQRCGGGAATTGEGIPAAAEAVVIERTFGWLIQHRRLARDFEALPQRSRAVIAWAMANKMSCELPGESVSWRPDALSSVTSAEPESTAPGQSRCGTPAQKDFHPHVQLGTVGSMTKRRTGMDDLQQAIIARLREPIGRAGQGIGRTRARWRRIGAQGFPPVPRSAAVRRRADRTIPRTRSPAGAGATAVPLP